MSWKWKDWINGTSLPLQMQGVGIFPFEVIMRERIRALAGEPFSTTSGLRGSPFVFDSGRE